MHTLHSTKGRPVTSGVPFGISSACIIRRFPLVRQVAGALIDEVERPAFDFAEDVADVFAEDAEHHELRATEERRISSFPSVQKREPQRDTAQRNSFSFLDRLLLLDVPPSECSLSALRAPNPRLSTHKRIDADAPLPGRMTGHAASGGTGQEGEARCTRPLSRRSRRTAKRRGWAERGCGFWKSRFCGERGEKNPCSFFC